MLGIQRDMCRRYCSSIVRGAAEVAAVQDEAAIGSGPVGPFEEDEGGQHLRARIDLENRAVVAVSTAVRGAVEKIAACVFDQPPSG